MRDKEISFHKEGQVGWPWYWTWYGAFVLSLNFFIVLVGLGVDYVLPNSIGDNIFEGKYLVLLVFGFPFSYFWRYYIFNRGPTCGNGVNIPKLKTTIDKINVSFWYVTVIGIPFSLFGFLILAGAAEFIIGGVLTVNIVMLYVCGHDKLVAVLNARYQRT